MSSTKLDVTSGQRVPVTGKVSRGNSEYRVILKILLLLRRYKQLHSTIAHAGKSSK